jgi:hypothetical protein
MELPIQYRSADIRAAWFAGLLAGPPLPCARAGRGSAAGPGGRVRFASRGTTAGKGRKGSVIGIFSVVSGWRASLQGLAQV